MKKRGVILGMPVYMWRKKFRPMLVVNGLVLIYFAAMFINDSEYFMDLLIHDPWIALLLIGFPGGVSLVAMFVFAVRANAYMNRFRLLGGRVCFVCDYEIGEGLESCSECGVVWSLEGLRKDWKKIAGEDR